MINHNELHRRLDKYRGKERWRTLCIFMLVALCFYLVPGTVQRWTDRIDREPIDWDAERRAYMAAQLSECRAARPLEALHWYMEKRADGRGWQKSCAYASAPGYPARTVILVEAAR